MRKFLHVGCGPAKKGDTTRGFNTDVWQEVCFDIDPACAPDIVGTVVDMSTVSDASVAPHERDLKRHLIELAARDEGRREAPADRPLRVVEIDTDRADYLNSRI